MAQAHKLVLIDPVFIVLRFEWFARVDCVRRPLADWGLDHWRFCLPKETRSTFHPATKGVPFILTLKESVKISSANARQRKGTKRLEPESPFSGQIPANSKTEKRVQKKYPQI